MARILYFQLDGAMEAMFPAPLQGIAVEKAESLQYAIEELERNSDSILILPFYVRAWSSYHSLCASAGSNVHERIHFYDTLLQDAEDYGKSLHEKITAAADAI